MLVLVSTHIFAVNDKVALVIGNSAYKNSPLKNPINDAQDMSNKLKKLGQIRNKADPF